MAATQKARRAARSAAHARWCGEGCLNGPACPGQPDDRELDAIIDAVLAEVQ